MIKRLLREAAFPCVGRLRKGGKKEVKTVTKNGQQKEIETYGKDLTYFRFDSDDARATAHFRAAYGDEPAQVNVFLPHQTAAQNFSCWQEAYLAGGLTHRCDGETCVIWLDGTKYRTDPKPCPGGCKEVGRLMVIIPELQRFAYVTVETHSINDIIRLQENLQAVEFLRGDLRGIPFILKRTPVEISTPTPDGKRARREKWLLSIEVDPAWAALQLESMHRAALTADGVTIDESRLLTTAYIEDEDGDDEITVPDPEPVKEPVQHRTPRPPAQAAPASDISGKFHKQITNTFGGLDIDDARHWYIGMKLNRPTGSTNDLSPEQMAEMIEDLRKNTRAIRQAYTDHLEPNERDKEALTASF